MTGSTVVLTCLVFYQFPHALIFHMIIRVILITFNIVNP